MASQFAEGAYWSVGLAAVLGTLTPTESAYGKLPLVVSNSLPDGPSAIVEDARGRIYVGVRGKDGGVFYWVGGEFGVLARGKVDGIAAATDARIWSTVAGRVTAFAEDILGLYKNHPTGFGKPIRKPGRVYADRRGGVWVGGYRKRRSHTGDFVPVPDCPIAGCLPAPFCQDPLGNAWTLAAGDADPTRREVLVIPAGEQAAWQTLPDKAALPVGAWTHLRADDLGYTWVCGEPGIRRFDPRKPQRGWLEPKHGLLSRGRPTALGLSPRGRALIGFEDGAIVEADVHADGKVIATRVTIPDLTEGPVRALHTDRDGSIWALAGGKLVCREAASPWRRLPRLPFGNHDFYGVVAGRRLYVAGGITNLGLPARMRAVDDFLAYDPAEEWWETLPSMSVKRGYAAIAALAGEIWVLGGYVYEDPTTTQQTTVDLVEIYNRKQKRWRRGPALDRPRAEHVALASGGRLYVIGGADKKDEFASVISIGPDEDTWRLEPDAPRSIRQAAGCVFDGKLWIARGKSDKHPDVPGLYVFNPKRRQWESNVPPMPIGPPNAPLMAAHKGEIWVMGGWGTKHPTATQIYAPRRRRWRRGPDLPTPLGWAAAAELNGKLVIAGGAYYGPEHRSFLFTDTCWELRPQ